VEIDVALDPGDADLFPSTGSGQCGADGGVLALRPANGVPSASSGQALRQALDRRGPDPTASLGVVPP